MVVYYKNNVLWTIPSSGICKNTLISHFRFLWFFWTRLECTSGSGLESGLTYMSLIVEPSLKGQQQVTRESDSHGEWWECKRPRQIIPAHLKFLVWQHGLSLPIFLWSKQANGYAQNQWGTDVYSTNNEGIALAGKEGRIADKYYLPQLVRTYFISLQCTC